MAVACRVEALLPSVVQTLPVDHQHTVSSCLRVITSWEVVACTFVHKVHLAVVVVASCPVLATQMFPVREVPTAHFIRMMYGAVVIEAGGVRQGSVVRVPRIGVVLS